MKNVYQIAISALAGAVLTMAGVWMWHSRGLVTEAEVKEIVERDAPYNDEKGEIREWQRNTNKTLAGLIEVSKETSKNVNDLAQIAKLNDYRLKQIEKFLEREAGLPGSE